MEKGVDEFQLLFLCYGDEENVRTGACAFDDR